MEKVKEKNKHELNDSKGQYRGRLFDFEQKKNDEMKKRIKLKLALDTNFEFTPKVSRW
jgi:penicillin-binding protein-related factor A (putative recombinase)